MSDPSGPFGTQPPRPPRASRPAANDGAIVPGSGILPLPGEVVLRTVLQGAVEQAEQGEIHGLHLTNRRILMFSRDRIFFLFPSGREVRTAMIEDVDSAGVRTKRLPGWVLALAVFLIVAGLVTMANSDNSESDFGDDSSNNNTAVGIVVILLGGLVLAVWILLKREAVVFSVSGEDLLEMQLWRFGGGRRDDAAAFIDEFFNLRVAAIRARPS